MPSTPRLPEPHEIGIGVLDARGDGAEIARAEFVFEILHHLDAARLGDIARALRHEQRGRKLGRGDEDGLGRIAGAGIGVEENVGRGLIGLRPADGRREMPLVGGEIGRPHRVLDVELLVALGDGHAGEDRRGAVRPENQIHLVGRDQPLVERARDIGLRLVVEQNILYRPTQQPALGVDLVDEIWLTSWWTRPVWASGPVSDKVWPTLIGCPAGAWAPARAASPRVASPARPVNISRRDQPRVFIGILSSLRAGDGLAPSFPAHLSANSALSCNRAAAVKRRASRGWR